MNKERQPAVHRWQPTGKTPCGRKVGSVAVNLGWHLSNGVTCKACNGAKTLVSVWGDQWNGQSAGYPRQQPTT